MRITSIVAPAVALAAVAFAPAGLAQNGNAAPAKAAFHQPGATLGQTGTPAKAITRDPNELVFSAPPRGSYDEEVAVYQPIADYLSKVTGKSVNYRFSDNWLSYSRDMTQGAYDIVFDGPAFNGWRINNLSHVPLIKLPEDFVFVVITRADNDKVKDVRDLAGRKVCAHAPPNLGTLTMLSRFDNPARQPVIKEIGGWDNNYKAMVAGECVATVVPIKNLQKMDNGASRVTKTLYQHKAMPNQAFSVGPRISTELRKKIADGLMSAEGKAATAKLRAAYAGKDFVPASSEEYAGLGDLLKNSLYYQNF
jgi:ABC-type phosphate/phosphonate transport system substrate-binding protein